MAAAMWKGWHGRVGYAVVPPPSAGAPSKDRAPRAGQGEQAQGRSPCPDRRGEKAPLTRVGGLGWQAPGLPFLPRLASNTAAQEGWWHPTLCENLPWRPQGTTARASPYPLGIPCPSLLATKGQGGP